MALTLLSTFSYQAYITELGDAPERMVDVLRHAPDGWAGLLNSYRWRDLDAASGHAIRTQWHRQLRDAAGNARMAVADTILQTLGMRAMPPAMRLGITQSLPLLDRLDDNLATFPVDLYARRIASSSKIYEMWDPTRWVIYDAFFALGLQWLVRQYWREVDCERNEELLRFPRPSPRSLTRRPLDGFVGAPTVRQNAIAFIYASWLCRRIAEVLNARSLAQKNTPAFWQASRIEMVLFQLGHRTDLHEPSARRQRQPNI